MTAMESIIRPFTAVVSTPKPYVPTAPVEENPEAFIEWGGPSDFSADSFREVASTPGFRVEDPGPESRVYDEEARTYEDFVFSNPEDDSQFVILRKSPEFAFRDTFDGSQWVFGFSNDYTAEDPPPDYLKNENGDEFAPLVLDPFHTVIEVGWAGGFVLIAIQVKPHTSVRFMLTPSNPVANLGIQSPEFERGDPEIPPSGADTGEPFIHQVALSSVIDNKDPGAPAHYTKEEEKAGEGISEFAGIKEQHVSSDGSAANFRVFEERSDWTHTIGEYVVSPDGLGPGIPLIGCEGLPDATWMRTEEFLEYGMSGCKDGANTMIESTTKPDRSMEPWFIPEMPGDGEVVQPVPGVYVFEPYQ